jgi:hypothetical protein
MNPNPHEIIAELNGAIANAELERMRAIEHLFSIVDGDDRDAAIDEARIYLKEKYGDSYEMLSAVCQKVGRLGEFEWPEELEVKE